MASLCLNPPPTFATFKYKFSPPPSPISFLEESSPCLMLDFNNSYKTRVPVILGSKPISFLEELSLTLMPDNNNPRAVTRTRAKNSDHDNLWYKFQPYPKMTEKPEWFWRSIASGFYLKPLLQFGAYGIFDPAYKVCKTLKNFGELTWEPYIRFIACFPQWLWYVYQAAIYFAVRRKELPHYLRFHMINGLLIDVGLEIFVYVNRWFPYSWLWSKVGMHVLTAVGIAYVLTILECIRGALIGMYPHAPFLSQASSIHTHLR
ncbi:hypothetical protein LIER_43379 [Lithospermum erythrorhizon]|uniref:Protein TIC 20 n=1 Tax=Lithospermum erythrorhizon TaxID=34254 RepID=A0AAV3PZT3_LITER